MSSPTWNRFIEDILGNQSHSKKRLASRRLERHLSVPEQLEDRTMNSALVGTAFASQSALVPESTAKALSSAEAHSYLVRNSSAAPLGVPSGLSPAQVKSAYGFSNVSFGTANADGSGQTIAIVDAYNDPNILRDLATFDSQFGLPAPASMKVVNQNGGTSLPQANQGWAGEIALDVEWSHAIAPRANILLVEANSASFSDLMKAVDYARSTPGVAVVSCSFGGNEFSSEASLDTHFTTPSGHAGVTFVVSAGDSGLPASYPSSSPDVLSVGGTTLRLASGAWSSETVWSKGGGGISAYESVPSYQNGLGLTGRGTPDVAYDADPNTGFSVYDSYGSGGWTVYGGTSAGAPQWAALVAIADEGRALGGSPSLANAQTAVYSLPRTDFHDIVSGNNGSSAKAGYDLASGLGSPIANRVIADLVAYRSGGGGGSSSISAPVITSLQATSSTTATLQWTAVSGATGYRVLLVNSDGTKTPIGNYGSSTTAVNISGMSPGSTYTFEIEAFNSTSYADSAPVSVTMPGGTTTISAPVITSLQATSSTTATLQWTAVSGATGYRVLLVNSDGTKTSIGNYGSSTTAVNISGMSPGSTYTFEIEAFNSTSYADSAPVSITMPGGTTTISAPVITSLQATSSTTATLQWTAVSGATGYRVLLVNSDGTKTSIGNYGSSTTAVNISGMNPGSTYTFEIEAFNSTSYADSAPVSITMPGGNQLSAPLVSARAISSSQVQLSWNSVSGAQGYRIYWWNGSQAVLLGTVGSSTTSVVVSGLSPGTTNYFLIQAFSNTSYANSNWVSAVTPYAVAKGALASNSPLLNAGATVHLEAPAGDSREDIVPGHRQPTAHELIFGMWS